VDRYDHHGRWHDHDRHHHDRHNHDRDDYRSDHYLGDDQLGASFPLSPIAAERPRSGAAPITKGDPAASIARPRAR
jgi:hypothetical protein